MQHGRPPAAHRREAALDRRRHRFRILDQLAVRPEWLIEIDAIAMKHAAAPQAAARKPARKAAQRKPAKKTARPKKA